MLKGRVRKITTNTSERISKVEGELNGVNRLLDDMFKLILAHLGLTVTGFIALATLIIQLN